MQANAESNQRGDLLPGSESYTAMINAYIGEQRRLIAAIDNETREVTPAVIHATVPNENPAEPNELGTVTIMELAEKVQNLLTLMEDFAGVSDHYSSMRLSGGIIVSDLRNASLQPTSYHYDAVISAFANVATAAHNIHYASHLIKQAPFMANRWLLRMEVIAGTMQVGTFAKVTPTVDSYFHVMRMHRVLHLDELPSTHNLYLTN